MNKLILHGIRQNNLKNLHLEFDHNKLIAITGLSGSGKSSLAFDTIYAEGGRRYIETFSPYTRQFLERLPRPDIDYAHGIRPALILRQHNQITSSRSTVGTLTEINEYLKLIWAQLADTICPKCRSLIQKKSLQDVYSETITPLLTNSSEQLIIAAPICGHELVTLQNLRDSFLSKGFSRLISKSTGQVSLIEETPDFSDTSNWLLVVDRIKPGKQLDNECETRILSGISQALQHGNEDCEIFYFEANGKFLSKRLSTKMLCLNCNTSFSTPNPSLFSFNNPIGACPKCSGFGKILTIDPRRCVPNPDRSIAEGAIACWNTPSTEWESKALRSFCKKNNIPTDKPWKSLSKKHQTLIFDGSDDSIYYPGVYGWFDYLHKKRHKLHVRVFLSRYRTEQICPECNGNRLKPEASQYRINDLTLSNAWKLSLVELESFISSLSGQATSHSTEIAVQEAKSRLKYLNEIGLGYLTLDRQTRTLSGGECQRVNLTSILGSRLTNTMLILDEPTVGLHPADTQRLIKTMKSLKQQGNTVFVVEHDQEVIKAADEILDLGPKSGANGGQVIFQGSPKDLLSNKESFTAQHLLGIKKSRAKKHKNAQSTQPDQYLSIIGAAAHNLKSIDVHIPINKFVVLSGISGSGKSTLLKKCLFESFQKSDLQNSTSAPIEFKDGFIKELRNSDVFTDAVFIDQTPLLRSPRSNCATYTKIWDFVRDAFAATPQAQEQGLSKSAFSFNVEGGRCPICKGAGYLKIEMQFLADAYVTCEACNGRRFQDSILNIKYGGKSISDFLLMTLDEVAEFFATISDNENSTTITNKLKPLLQLGLGYLKLGQPLSQLSGGEAQRVKLASYLDKNLDDKYLFLLDEPTSGLHPHDISLLVQTFQDLIDRGHSVFCIEHNLDVIANADWIIDLGPGAGIDGGEIVVAGDPWDLCNNEQNIQKSKTLKALLEATKNNPQLISANSSSEKIPPRKYIHIHGAKQHNLKNINVDIPLGEISLITGVSGSGKSTLAFDILFSEGQRRYIDCLSPYARHYLTQIKPADVDFIDALPPTISVSQKTAISQKLSTIATVSEIYQYLRLLYAKVGTLHCPEHNLPVQSYSPELIVAEASNLKAERVFVFAPVVQGRKGTFKELIDRAIAADLTEARIDNQNVKLVDLALNRHQRHWISILVASLNLKYGNLDLLEDAIKQALLLSGGNVEIVLNTKNGKPITYSTERVCPECKRGFRELDPQDFSFQASSGACNNCEGTGFILNKKSKEHEICSECGGSRLNELGRSVYINSKTISELADMTAPELRKFLQKTTFPERLNPVVQPIVSELVNRLDIIDQIGLGYLKLQRASNTLSGGEAQRLRLARTLGTPLSGACYILDEPSIGLHPQDNQLLLQTFSQLKEKGNTVVIVEHDETFIRNADYVIDLGPNGGSAGGEVAFSGTPQNLISNSESLTALALRQKNVLKAPNSENNSSWQYLELKNCTANNLKSISVKIPTAALTVVCGISGAGKSSLVHQCLKDAVQGRLAKGKIKARLSDDLILPSEINRYIEIDQEPLGKSSTSCPASYLGIFDEIRKFFAQLPEAQVNGLNASYFSFNTGKGRCATCHGKGTISIPMGFLPEAVTICEDCNGLRYDPIALQVRFQGLNIGEVLQLTISEALSLFKNHKKIKHTLTFAEELGIGYLVIGQPTFTLSGGEAQRLKIAYELGRGQAQNTLYVLDEPTVGLHMMDVAKLLAVINKLAALGNTIVIIEHNLDIISQADYLIELGPGPGDGGGKLLFQGTLSNFIKNKVSTATKLAILSRL